MLARRLVSKKHFEPMPKAKPTPAKPDMELPDDVTIEVVDLSSFRPAEINSNAGNQNSVPLIKQNIEMNGIGRPMFADKNGQMLGGSHTRQAIEDARYNKAIVVKSSGNIPIIHQRTDVDIDSSKGRSLQVGDNVIGIKSYQQDDEILAALLSNIAADDAALVKAAGFEENDIRALMNRLQDPDNPYAEWVGMPEFEHDDLTAYQNIHVHFKSAEDVQAFAKLIGQLLTDKTRSIWFPQIEIIRYGVVDES